MKMNLKKDLTILVKIIGTEHPVEFISFKLKDAWKK